MVTFKQSNPEKAVQRDIEAASKIRERPTAQLAEFAQAISLRRTKAALIYRRTGKSRAVQLLLGQAARADAQ